MVRHLLCTASYSRIGVVAATPAVGVTACLAGNVACQQLLRLRGAREENKACYRFAIIVITTG